MSIPCSEHNVFNHSISILSYNSPAFLFASSRAFSKSSHSNGSFRAPFSHDSLLNKVLKSSHGELIIFCNKRINLVFHACICSFVNSSSFIPNHKILLSSFARSNKLFIALSSPIDSTSLRNC
jgi:hypothetical protein